MNPKGSPTGVHNGLADCLRKLSRRENGVRANDKALAEWTPKQRSVQIARMVANGELFKATLSHKLVVYFASAAAAADCQRRAKAHPGAGQERTQAVPPNWKDLQADTSRAKRTTGPAHRERFQAVDLPIHGGLQRGRVARDPRQQYRVWADGTVQAVDSGEPYHWMSDDFMVVLALDERDAREQGNA